MGSIFRHCSEVIVWLGPSDSNSVKFFNFVDRLRDCDWGDLLPETMWMGALDTLNDVLIRASVSPMDTEVGKAALEAVLKRKWFWRLWTFQEAVLATSLTFWCGKDCCSLKDMYEASRVLMILYSGITGAISLDNIMSHRTGQEAGGSYLDDLLLDMNDGGYQCSEPHDRIYALLALQRHAGSDGHCIIPVDYEKPIETVMEEVMRIVISSTRRLRILHRHTRLESLNSPSWVPNWTEFTFVWALESTCFKASGDLTFQGRPRRAGLLQAEGRIVATITESRAHRLSTPQKLEDSELFQNFPSAIVAVNSVLTSILVRDIVPQMLVMLMKPHDITGRIRSSEEAILNLLATTFCRDIPNTYVRCTSQDSDDAMNTFIEFIQELTSHAWSSGPCLRRKFAFLDKWETPIALVPYIAEVGDVICILNGSSLPLVLRKKGQRYQFIGPSFVHGMMHGEVVDWVQGEGDIIEIE